MSDKPNATNEPHSEQHTEECIRELAAKRDWRHCYACHAVHVFDAKDRQLAALAAQLAEAKAERDEAVPYMIAVRNAHNGYDAEARKTLHDLKEPETPEQALRELGEEYEAMLAAESAARIQAEKERDEAKEAAAMSQAHAELCKATLNRAIKITTKKPELCDCDWVGGECGECHGDGYETDAIIDHEGEGRLAEIECERDHAIDAMNEGVEACRELRAKLTAAEQELERVREAAKVLIDAAGEAVNDIEEWCIAYEVPETEHCGAMDSRAVMARVSAAIAELAALLATPQGEEREDGN